MNVDFGHFFLLAVIWSPRPAQGIIFATDSEFGAVGMAQR